MSSAGGMGRAWQRLRALPGRTSLRVKLVSAILVLVTVALVVISFAGISFLSSYLLRQADDQLAAQTGFPLQRTLQTYLQNPSPQYLRGEAVVWVPDGGKEQQIVIPVLVTGIGLPGNQQVVPGPDLPANVSSLPSDAQHAITVGATSGGGRWRIVGLPATQNNPNGTVTHGTVVVGTDVTSVYSTTGELTDIDLIVSLAIIVVLAVVGVAVIRASLRPLTEIERTAEGIAAGDLTRRVPDRDPRTEVGRLGRSLNSMLAQIETAFDARAASELAARRSEERMRQFVADASHELRTPLTAIRGFAEYYRQRGGVEEISGAPSRPALGNGADTAAHHADTAAQEADAAAHQARTGAHEAATASSDMPTTSDDSPTTSHDRPTTAHDGPASPRDADVSPGPAPEGAGQADGGQLARADLDRIMQRVEQESSRMGVLVEDMLLLARLDQQRPLEQRTVDMLTLAADAVHDARVVAPDRNIGLTVGAGAALLVVGDEVRLRQVIGNLMSNALNHTPDGTPIEVRVRSGSLDEWRRAAAGAGQTAFAASSRDVQPLPAVILEVADQGPGLTPYQAEHVFERFYRADQARTRKAGGTGLGLAIVAALVAAHGGTVWAESPPGGGATFRIAIPLAPEARHSEPDPDDGADGPDVSAGVPGPRG
jgi:two-component system, OmpR family, sensor kinase